MPGDVDLIGPHLQDVHEHPLGASSMEMLAVGKHEESSIAPLANPVHRFSLFPTWRFSFGQAATAVCCQAWNPGFPHGRLRGAPGAGRLPAGPARESSRIASVNSFISNGIRKKQSAPTRSGDVLVAELRLALAMMGLPWVALEVPDQHEGLDEAVGLEVDAPLAERHVVEEQDEKIHRPLIGQRKDPVNFRCAVDLQPVTGIEGLDNRLGDDLDECVVEVSHDDVEISSGCHSFSSGSDYPADLFSLSPRGGVKLEVFCSPGARLFRAIPSRAIPVHSWRTTPAGYKKQAFRPLLHFSRRPRGTRGSVRQD
ncbi:MAG: hypothetical protein L7F78_09030 [Syntrophales bacterium LBB04]|nr:hypothetical protein [Syntrophales bacterium LBB04]